MLDRDMPSTPTSGRSLSWYMKRLRVMRPAEVVHRVAEQCALKMLEIRHRGGRTGRNDSAEGIKRFAFCSGSAKKLPALPWSLALTGEAAETLLRGRLHVLGHEWTWRPDPSVWHEALDTHRAWPQVFFNRIPYREGNPYGDIRIAWEPSRLQQLIALGLLAQDRGPEMRRRAVAQLEGQFLSWVEANPFLTGIHYISVMECGLRILSLCHAVDLVREWLQDAERIWTCVIDVIGNHARLIHKRLSVHSSAGNHTVAEAAALVYAGILFPEMEEAARWRVDGLSLLEQEAPRQILPDGGGSEQSFCYLRFVSDLYGLVVMLLKHQQRNIPTSIEQAFRRSLFFLKQVSLRSGELPRIGDGDSGFALSPFLEFSERDTQQPAGCRTFEVSGYSIIRASRGHSEQQLIFDHGPLGMDPCYAHGHADALALVLHVGRREVLVDAGTYSYTGYPTWRKYFRGTRAHNTVTVDGLDQAVQETAFLWAQPFQSRKVRKELLDDGSVMIVSCHDGYRKRLGVMHWRAVLHQPPSVWLICDRLLGGGEHFLELNWHLGVEPVLSADGYLLHCDNEILHLALQGGTVATLHHGEKHPISGWRSPHYGVKESIFTLQTSYRGTVPHEFFTQIWSGERSPAISAGMSLLRGIIDEAQTH